VKALYKCSPFISDDVIKPTVYNISQFRDDRCSGDHILPKQSEMRRRKLSLYHSCSSFRVSL